MFLVTPKNIYNSKHFDILGCQMVTTGEQLGELQSKASHSKLIPAVAAGKRRLTCRRSRGIPSPGRSSEPTHVAVFLTSQQYRQFLWPLQTDTEALSISVFPIRGPSARLRCVFADKVRRCSGESLKRNGMVKSPP